MSKLSNWSSYALAAFRVVVGYVFLQPGLEKLFGFQGARIDHNFGTLHGFAGLLEFPGAILLMVGLFTRPTAFILSGEMCVAYFRSWAPRGFWPITNSGELCVILSFAFLWLAAAGAGPWSLDALIQARRKSASGLRDRVASWEGYARSILRIIVAFTFSLHGYRLMFGLFATPAGRLTRQQRIGVAIDSLPHLAGLLVIIGGVLLFLGLFTRLTALILSVGPALAYLTIAAPRGPWSINNGGQETLLYLFLFIYYAAAGAGDWSLDNVLEGKRQENGTSQPTGAQATT